MAGRSPSELVDSRSVFDSGYVGDSYGLAVNPSPLPQQSDDLSEFPQRHPGVLGSPGIRLLAPQPTQRGPVEGPGLLDRQLLGHPRNLVEPADQVLVDRTLGGPVGMVLDHRRCYRPPPSLKEIGQPRPPTFTIDAVARSLRSRLLLLKFARIGVDPGANPDNQNRDIVESPPQVGQADEVSAGVLGMEVAGEGADLRV